MQTPPSKPHPVTLTKVFVTLAIVLVLAQLCVPPTSGFLNGQLTQTLSNAHEIQIATRRMALDYGVEDPNLGWPGDASDLADVGDFAERLVEYHYLDRSDLTNLFLGPGIQPYLGQGKFRSANSAFKVYCVSRNDLDRVIFIATRNFTFGQPLDPKQAPYGKKGAVIVQKGGEGRIISDEQAAHSVNGKLGLMTANDPSPGTESSVLK